MTMSLSKKRGRPPMKKRGRPVGSKNKAKQVAPAASRATFKQAEHQRALHNIVDENLRLLEENQQFRSQVASLNHQIVGFRAVISYLENRLDVPSSQ